MSAKVQGDPIRRLRDLAAPERRFRPRFYCAGKIAFHDWRHDGFPRLRDALFADGGPAPLDRLELVPENDDFIYVGPYFLACDHGCAHGGTLHGLSAGDSFVEELVRFNGAGGVGGCVGTSGQGAGRVDVVRACRRWLWDADLVFVWICADFLTAYGTMAEIGMATAMGKPVFSAMAADMRANIVEAWFPLTMTGFLGRFRSPLDALDVLAGATESLWREGYLPGDERDPRHVCRIGEAEGD